MRKPAPAPCQRHNGADLAAPPATLARAPTPFESRLYAACRCIPAGRVTTYGALAKALGSSPRAVGQALRRNPFAPEVPCHRVIAASLELGGFSGSWGLQCPSVQKKRRLLGEEGVAFDGAGRVVDAALVLPASDLARVAGLHSKS